MRCVNSTCRSKILRGAMCGKCGLDNSREAGRIALEILDERGIDELLCRNTGADHIDAIQCGFAFDVGLLALTTESVFLDEQAEMLPHLIAAQNLPHGQANLLASA